VHTTIEQAREIILKNNPSEIVITGVNTGDFGRKNGESFLQLIRELDQLDGVQRFRISSIEPNLLNDEIISFCASSNKFVPHFHIPLQSGSDRILRLMRRRYQRDVYTSRVAAIRETMPDACIGVDVIVGFPGETDHDFLETYQYLVDLPVSYLHVFTYSERDNTLAASMPDAVDGKVRAQRSEMLRILSEKKKQAFYRSQLGTERKVLWEAEQNGDSMFGFTDNYVKVRTPWNSNLINTISMVRLMDIDSDGIVTCAELIHIF
jgi:threonylcarbamoyladenosine tRNA methylthiotransferase MtaB